MTLLTLSKIKRVCSLSLVPRLFRGDGCTPGKFHRLSLGGIQKVEMSSKSDDSKNEEGKCKKCKKLIEYAFGPPEVFDGENVRRVNVPHANLCANPDLKKDDTSAELAKEIKSKKDVNYLEDLKSMTVEHSKADSFVTPDVDLVITEVAKEYYKTPDDLKENKRYFVKESKSSQITTKVPKESPSILALNDGFSDINIIKELLWRGRVRNKIMYCREIGIQMAKRLAALNSEGKCGGKPPCPPPPHVCPPPQTPPPPKCPPPKPPCPKPCEPPPPAVPPPAKKDPCANSQMQDTV